MPMPRLGTTVALNDFYAERAERALRQLTEQRLKA